MKRTKIFTKSGSRVRVVSRPKMVRIGKANIKCVSVERLDTGKRMMVAVNALIPEEEEGKEKMIEVIHKFPLERAGKCSVTMPLGAEILSVQMQGSTPTLWARVKSDSQKEIRHFRILMTGEEFVETKHLKYLATLQDGPFVVHVFEDRFYHNKR